MSAARLLGLGLCSVLAACTTGEGSGHVRSTQLFVKDCWSGEFDLQPTFFGANSFEAPDGTDLFIRVQRGDNTQEVSDGVFVLVKNVGSIRRQMSEQPGGSFALGLPAGVTPAGVPVEVDPDPAQVHLSLYLMDTCQAQNSVLHAIEGEITFNALFSGDPNEDNAEDRLTDATFVAQVTDPRYVLADGSYPEGSISPLEGRFRFYFQRGQPAQPFP
jgi:hypothetical protein